MAKEKVSVVVTVLNEEKSITKLLKGLFSQSLQADEVIIVDGGSSDSTLLTISSFVDCAMQSVPVSKTRVRVFRKNGNRSVGRNYGIEKAKNNLIAVCDAGCFPKQDWLEKITESFQHKDVWIVSGYYRAYTKTLFEKCIVPYFLVMPDKLPYIREFWPSSRSVAFRKEAWVKGGKYPEQFSDNEDLVFDRNLKEAGFSFHFAPEAIVWWLPPKTLAHALEQMFRFALGDAESGIVRDKIKYIFLRYGVGVLLILLRFYGVFFLFFIFYILYSIFKNFRYVKEARGLFWLPVIQITSDIVVMSGYICGMIKSRTLDFKKYGLGNNSYQKRREKY